MVISLAIACGGGVRVGLEDNIWYDPQRDQLSRNSDLLLRIRRIINANEKNVMTPVEFRKRLHLQSGNGQYGRVPVDP